MVSSNPVLACVAGMSVTSFHRHFRAVTTMTPIQYQKQIRLQEARARLIAAVHGTSHRPRGRPSDNNRATSS